MGSLRKTTLWAPRLAHLENIVGPKEPKHFQIRFFKDHYPKKIREKKASRPHDLSQVLQ